MVIEIMKKEMEKWYKLEKIEMQFIASARLTNPKDSYVYGKDVMTQKRKIWQNL
jgi:hypothetical protein